MQLEKKNKHCKNKTEEEILNCVEKRREAQEKRKIREE